MVIGGAVSRAGHLPEWRFLLKRLSKLPHFGGERPVLRKQFEGALFFSSNNGAVLSGDLGLEKSDGIFGEDAYIIATSSCPVNLTQIATGQSTRLKGPHAIALFNPVSRHLQLTRDQLGEEEIFYCQEGGVAFFANRMPVLLALLSQTPSLDEASIAMHLYMQTPLPGKSYYHNILSVRPSHSVTFDSSGETKINRFWRLEPQPIYRGVPERACLDVFTEILDTSIRKQLDDASKPGFMLSGGLDSSLITAIGCRTAPNHNFHAFGFMLPENHEGPEKGERNFFSAVCDHFPNLECHTVALAADNLFGSSDEAMLWTSGPVRHASQHLTDRVAEAAIACGAGTLVTGLGGDHCVSMAQTPNVIEALLRGRIDIVVEMLRRNSMPFLARAFLRDFLPSIFSKGAQGLPQIRRSPLREEAPILQQIAASLPPETRIKLTHQPSRLSGLQTEAIESIGEMGSLAQSSFLLESKNLSVLNPLLDIDLLEAGISLPYGAIDPASWDRKLIRQLSRRHLPSIVAQRTTKALAVPTLQRLLSESAVVISKEIRGLSQHPVMNSLLDVEKTEEALTMLHNTDNWWRSSTLSWRLIVPIQVGRFLSRLESG